MVLGPAFLPEKKTKKLLLLYQSVSSNIGNTLSYTDFLFDSSGDEYKSTSNQSYNNTNVKYVSNGNVWNTYLSNLIMTK